MTNATCSADGCSRSAIAKTWCLPHYKRWKKHGDIQAHIPIRERVAESATCSVPGCSRPMAKRQLCDGHYQRLLLTGTVGPAEFQKVRKWSADADCAVPVCDRTIVAKGWCAPHFYRQLYTGDVQADRPLKATCVAGQLCAFRNCANDVKALGLCGDHYRMDRIARIKADPVRVVRLRAYHREFKAAEYRRDPERAKAQSRAWRQANPERVKLFDAAKRQRRRGAVHIRFTADQLAAKIRYWGESCWVCRMPWEAVDHVKPLNRGGWHMLANLRPICTSCNSRKRDKWPYQVPLSA